MIESSSPYFSAEDEFLMLDAMRTSKGAARAQYQEKLKIILGNLFSGYAPVFFSHCTNAIFTTLVEIASKDSRREVIIPALSWVTTASTVISAGLTPIFVDVEFDSACLDLSKVEAVITDNTLAVMTVGLFGNTNDLFSLVSIKQKFPEIYWLEDSAESLGAVDVKTKQLSGNFGDVSFLSFHSTKLINAGQGGVALFRDKNLAKKVSVRGHHGIDMELTGKYYWSESLGYNFAWSDIAASLAYSQFCRFNSLVEARRKIFYAYKAEFGSTNENFQLQQELDHVDQVFWLPYFLSNKFLEPGEKDAFIKHSLDAGIAFRPLFYPLVEMKPFQVFLDKGNIRVEWLRNSYPNTYRISELGVSLPTGAVYDEKNISSVVKLIRKYLF